MDEDSEGHVKNGTLTVTLSAWQQFHLKVHDLRSRRGYVWRGQKRDRASGWRLQSSFDREFPTKDERERTDRLGRHLGNFWAEMNSAYPKVLPRDEVAVWALGQHYGLKTPLLDWTLSPYIAAYFAFIEAMDPDDQDDRFRYVYALNRSLERLLEKRRRAGEVLSSARSVLFVDRLPYLNPRFTAQRGVFTMALHGRDMWDYIQTYSHKRPDEILVVEIRIPSRDRDECLSELHLMNIDHMSLLLDLRDAIDRCNAKLRCG